MTDETIGNVPILILGNKIDRPEAISEEKLREMFGLYGQTTGKVRRRWFICQDRKNNKWRIWEEPKVYLPLAHKQDSSGIFLFYLCLKNHILN